MGLSRTWCQKWGVCFGVQEYDLDSENIHSISYVNCSQSGPVIGGLII